MKSERWTKFITVESSENIDIKRKKSVMYFFTYVGSFTLLVFAFKTPIDENITLKLSLLGFAVFLFLNAFLAFKYKKIIPAMNLSGLMILPLVLTVVYTGGYENTALYWAYPFPIAIFVFFGYLRGLALNLLMFFLIYIIIQNPESTPANYRVEEVERFTPTFLVNVFLCFIAEYFRSRSHSELSTLNFNRLRLANTDSLTQLPNRRFIDSVFMETANNDRRMHFPMAIVAVDIDHFKNINDTYGHDIGDKVLKYIAHQLRRKTREMDVVARIGGEEFLMIFPRTSIEVGAKIAEKIRQLICQTPFVEDELSIKISVSLGCTDVFKYAFIDDAIKQADELLYQAKRNGRNRLEVKKFVPQNKKKGAEFIPERSNSSQ